MESRDWILLGMNRGIGGNSRRFSKVMFSKVIGSFMFESVHLFIGRNAGFHSRDEMMIWKSRNDGVARVCRRTMDPA
jgi:hypothetical protein